MNRSSLLLCMGLATLAAGCGGASSVERYETQLDTQGCEFAVRCGQFGRSEEKRCRNLAAASADLQRSVYSTAEAVAGGRLAFDADAAARCLALGRDVSCNVYDSAWVELRRTCQRVFEPLVPDGGACRDSRECRSGSCRGGDPAGCAGTCVATSVCTPYSCVGDNFCDPITEQCAPRRAVGGACTGDDDCQTDLVCFQSLSSGRSCQTPGPRGAPCTLSKECQTSLYCDRSGQCADRLQAGASCYDDMECRDGLLCIDRQNSAPGRCSEFLDIGSSCDPTQVFSACPRDSICDPETNRCHTLTTGESCLITSCVGADYCDSGTRLCTPRKRLGEACTPTPASSDERYNPCPVSAVCDSTSRVCSLECR